MNANDTGNGTKLDFLHDDCQNHIPKNELEEFRWFGIIIGILDIVVGGFGNGLTIAAFLTNKKLWSTFNIFIVNLSIIDFLTAVFMMPLHVVGYVLMEWPFPQWMCAFQAYIYFCCGYTSVVCLVAITLNRLVGIVYPLHYKRFFSSCRTSLAIVFCWFVAPLFLLPFLIFSNSDGTQMMGWREDQLLCTFTNLEPKFELYMKLMRVLFQFVPACIMIVSYTISVWDVSRTSSNQLLKPPTLQADKSRRTSRKSMDKSPSHSFSESRQRRKNNWRLLLISVLMCSVYSMLFIPSVVINLLPNKGCLDSRLHMTCSFITWLNSCVNPILYCLLYPRFQAEYRRLLRKATHSMLGLSRNTPTNSFASGKTNSTQSSRCE